VKEERDNGGEEERSDAVAQDTLNMIKEGDGKVYVS
jgi:hypothetical protein